MAKKTTESRLDHTYADPVDVREFINPQFMGMKPKDIDELDGQLDDVFAKAERDLNEAEDQCNDTWKKSDVFGDVNGSESELHED